MLPNWCAINSSHVPDCTNYKTYTPHASRYCQVLVGLYTICNIVRINIQHKVLIGASGFSDYRKSTFTGSYWSVVSAVSRIGHKIYLYGTENSLSGSVGFHHFIRSEFLSNIVCHVFFISNYFPYFIQIYFHS